MHRALERNCTRDRQPTTRTTCTFLFSQDKKLSQINRKKTRSQIDDRIKIAPAYETRIRDGVYVPDKDTFHDAYKVLQIPHLPSKTREVAFQILNRTTWTNNKAFKSRMSQSPNCDRCDEIETMEHMMISCPHYSERLWEECSKLTTKSLAKKSGEYVSAVVLGHKEVIFNKPHSSIKLFIKIKHERLIVLWFIQEIKREILYRRMNINPDQQRTPILLIRIQAHILSTLTKMKSQL